MPLDNYVLDEIARLPDREATIAQARGLFDRDPKLAAADDWLAFQVGWLGAQYARAQGLARRAAAHAVELDRRYQALERAVDAALDAKAYAAVMREFEHLVAAAEPAAAG